MPAPQGDTIHLPPWQAMASWGLRQCGSDVAGTHESPGWGRPVSQISAEPTPAQCAGPRQLWSMRHWPLAQVSASRPSGVHAMESLPGLQTLPTT